MKYKKLLFLSTVIIVLLLSSVSFAAIPIDVTVRKRDHSQPQGTEQTGFDTQIHRLQDWLSFPLPS